MKPKRKGFTDRAIAELRAAGNPGGPHDQGTEVRAYRLKQGIKPVYKMVDTCAAEFEATTPYYYSTYETENEVIGDGQAENRRARLRPDPDRPRH